MADSARQLEGLRHCPDKRVQRAVAIAEEEMQRAERERLRANAIADKARLQKSDDARKIRELQEQLAAEHLGRDNRALVVLHRDGLVEVWARSDLMVKVAKMPDLGSGNEEEAEAHMLKRLPAPYREIYELDGKRIAADTCKGCLSRAGFRLLKIEEETIRAVNAIANET